MDRVRRVTLGLIDDEQGNLRAGRGCVDQIFTVMQIGEKTREKKRRMYVGFIDLEKAYDKINRKALWEVLRMYDVGGNVESLTYVRIKGGENVWFRIDSGVRQRCIMSSWLFNVQYIWTQGMKEVKIIFRRGVRSWRRESGDYMSSCMQMTLW